MGTLIQAPTAPHTGTVIFLHGLGQSNETWAHGAVKALAKELPHILWLLPQSPQNPVALNQGERRPSWFDIALTTLHKLGGVASLSGSIPIAVREQMVHAAQVLPILWCHGDTDNKIPLSLGKDAVQFIRSKLRIKEPRLQFNEYADLGHTVNDEELDDLVAWLRGVLP
ncbi:hypothetical protein PAXRUDRAFT_32333 [Paxillus rubicundulus Ve08.2h10]|uniref:Acyl-protein thioesterase 1 n=1 Tax=Paxillus rubicundulus Ve08.2h10 TaxID=930991 RepID=A0A0D0E5A7_9AGAM|nr:hypothetical protein PAXRUDRAFT_32333 [Paxillus rubicundulus Ve08.2h10]